MSESSEPGPDATQPGDERAQRSDADAVGEPQTGPPPTPFDHPLFLPVLLVAFCAWFGYDAYLNQDPEMLEHLAFNRFGVRVLGFFTVLFGIQGLAELRGERAPSWLPALLLGVMAAWLAYDGWLSSDPLNLEYAAFNRHMSAALLGMAGVYGWIGRVRGRGEREPRWLAPLALVAAGAWFGFRAWSGAAEPQGFIHSLSALFLVGLGLWLGFGARRGGPAAEPSDAAEPS